MALVGCSRSLQGTQPHALPAQQNLAHLGRLCSAGMVAMIAMIENDDVDDGDGDGDGDDDDGDSDDSDE